jgi:hypothetical protein
MIDGFVVLSPLVVLPVVVLFVFVGCALDRSGIPGDGPGGAGAPTKPRVRFRYGPGFETGIASLDVRFLYTPKTEFTPHEIAPADPLTVFNPNGGVVDRTGQAGLDQAAPGWLSCACDVTAGNVVTTINFGTQTNDGNQELGTFVLSRLNGFFDPKIEP